MPKNIAKPSKMSQTNIWTKYQTKNDAIILNLWLHIAAGLPLGLCHPIFHSFQKEVFGKLPEARPFQEEKQRKFYAKNMLEKYLESTFIEYKFDNNRSTDGSIMFINGSFETLLLSMEVKPEIGIGNGCPYIQGTNKLANLKEWYEDFQHKTPKINAIRSPQLHFPYINFITKNR
ncbi:10946_t:CDS:2, partial [Entrophospora sp. SA101]